MRRFEVVSRLKDEEIKLPERSTIGSAGYDFFAIEDIDIYPTVSLPSFGIPFINPNNGLPTLVKTGIKAYMPDDEYLMLCIRSSMAMKKGLILANSIGIIDSSYVNNIDNEGEIGFLFTNLSSTIVHINKGDKIGQGIFMKYCIIDDDNINKAQISSLEAKIIKWQKKII